MLELFFKLVQDGSRPGRGVQTAAGSGHDDDWRVSYLSDGFFIADEPLLKDFGGVGTDSCCFGGSCDGEVSASSHGPLVASAIGEAG